MATSKTCPSCKGERWFEQEDFHGRKLVPCGTCNGTGVIPNRTVETHRWDILEEVSAEREMQDRKWGPTKSREDYLRLLAVLGEEFGEVCKAMLEHDPDAVREESIQVAAVAVQIVEWLDRK